MIVCGESRSIALVSSEVKGAIVGVTVQLASALHNSGILRLLSLQPGELRHGGLRALLAPTHGFVCGVQLCSYSLQLLFSVTQCAAQLHQ
mmetsp:Transcript_7751/g.17040  ORF Transcript_7751/g.17040 Transcript_7751/m.17040 type:complete len:90 (+) Transcript_7751:109-378(+)